MQMHGHENTHIKFFSFKEKISEKLYNKCKGFEVGTYLQLWAAAESSLAGMG